MKITVSHDLVGWFYCPRCGIEYCTDGDDYDFCPFCCARTVPHLKLIPDSNETIYHYRPYVEVDTNDEKITFIRRDLLEG